MAKEKAERDDLSYLEKFSPLLPLYAAIFALSFDVGYFYGTDISYFTLFSLSEHILFSIQVLPFVIFIVLASLIGITLGEKLTGLSARRRRSTESEGGAEAEGDAGRAERLRRKTRRFFLVFYASLFLSAAVSIYFEYYHLGIGLFCLLVASSWLQENELSDSAAASIFAFVFLGVVAALLLGHHTGQSYVSPSKATSLIEMQSGDSMEGRLIRSGSGGILFAAGNSGAITFLRWDSVRSISRIGNRD